MHVAAYGAEIAPATPPPARKPHLVFLQYEERLNRRRASPSTVRNVRRTAALFAEAGLDPLTAEDWQIEEWLAGLQLAPRTKKLHLENVNAVFGYAVQRHLMKVSPTETVRLPRVPDQEPHILTAGELRTVLSQATSDHQWLLAHLLIFTGMRRNEVRQIRWEDVSPESIRVVNGKGGKLRHVPVHPQLGEALVDVRRRGDVLVCGPRGQELSLGGLGARLEKITVGVRCSFHDFRRTVATSLAENDVPERLIDEIMGWAPRTVGRRYYIRNASRRTQEAILRLYADAPVTARRAQS